MVFQNNGIVKIEMEDMLRGAINMVDIKVLANKVSTPATKKLFDITEGAEQLNEKHSELFHTIVAK